MILIASCTYLPEVNSNFINLYEATVVNKIISDQTSQTEIASLNITKGVKINEDLEQITQIEFLDQNNNILIAKAGFSIFIKINF